VDGIDWAGLSWRKLRGWRRGSQCLARCDSSHRFNRWCLLGEWRGRRAWRTGKA
jgi:hypothetical protein